MELDPTLLERTLPATGERPDWGDVVVRAERARRRRTRRVGILVALAALAVGVTSAFGGRIAHLFHGEPAPPGVQRSAGELIPPDPIEALMGRQSTQVIAAETRGVIRLDTSAGAFYLWSAPTTDGGRCVILTFGSLLDEQPAATGNCLFRGTDNQLVVGNDVGMPGAEDTLVEFGLVPHGAASAALHTRDGKTIPVQLVDDAFLVELPKGTKLRDVVALDVNGSVIAKQPLVFHRPRGCCPPKLVPPRDAEYRTLFTVETSIGVMTLKTAPGYPGCYEVDMPVVDGSSSGSGTCSSPAHLPVPVQYGITPLKGDVHGPILIDGSTRADVRSVELRFEDGSALPLPLHDGYFMAELPHGKRPTVFGVRLASGREATQEFAPRPTPRP